MLNELMKKSNEKKKKKGFTLIELIIVIAIIAILAAVALPKFLDVTANANKKADLANAKTIESTITMLIANNDIKVTTVIAETKIDKAAAAGSNARKVADALQTIPKPKAVEGDFFFAIGTDGTITVSAGEDAATAVEIIQEPDGVYK